MVAITVILSAIIATFVLDLGGSVSQNPSAGVTFDEVADGQVQVQLVSAENADSVELTRSDESGTYSASFSAAGDSATVGDKAGQGTETFGTDASTNDAALTAGDTLTVTATLDGKTSVIQTYDYSA
jgi:FlaG/FlaF family flagellin (archaellin)